MKEIRNPLRWMKKKTPDTKKKKKTMDVAKEAVLSRKFIAVNSFK
jgi:hypothetical protein